jgi:hypothetical protein
MTYTVFVVAVLVGLVCPVVFAGSFDLTHGSMTLTFDDENGSLLRMTSRGEELASVGRDVSPITFATGEPGNIRWMEQMGLSRRLVSRAEPSPGVVELTVKVGDFELVERYALHGDRPRLDRSVQITNRGEQTVKLRGLVFVMAGVRAEGDGFYRLPGDMPPRSYRFGDMQADRKRYGHGSIAPALAQLPNARTLMWASLTEDSPSIEITEYPGRVWVRQGVDAAGFLRPGQPQKIGFVTTELLPGDYWSALPHLWDWMDSVDLRVPDDRPDWTTQAVLYSFHPGGTIGSNFTDLGGFGAATAKLLPTLPALGVTAIWVMPIEQTSPYWPFDYYKFMDGLGSGEDYQRLVDAAHGLGMRVIQDIVPHGGSPKAVHNVAHPEFMLRREDGSTFDYWLNDFAWPQWQQFMFEVAGHYVKTYGIDGYRIDACYGSKEPNWNPEIPYDRASLAGMWGGLGMVRTIRQAVRQARPDGAVLAEVQSARHLAVSDAMYDFGFCYSLLHQWRRTDAEQFAKSLGEFLEEQKYSEPRGAVRLRHVESHDSLRSQLWYGVAGMRAMYALSAWIDGIPLIYHGQEIGHEAELARINRIRQERPELRGGVADYRAVTCDTPGVFTCLRTLGENQSVVVINFNREPVTAGLAWRGGKATVRLAPLGYTVVPEPSAASPGSINWFVDTIEGRLSGVFTSPQSAGRPLAQGPIYWRPQGEGVLWQNDMVPLHPIHGAIGIRGGDGAWQIAHFRGEAPADLRLVERDGQTPGLVLVGAGAGADMTTARALPPAPDATSGVKLGGVSLRCVGPEYIIANDHYTVTLRRQGGCIRQVRSPAGVLLENQDLYGDQPYFQSDQARRIDASSDVESGIRIWSAQDGLHLAFEGQLRGNERFALMRPPVLYRTQYTFSDAASFRQSWAVCSSEGFADKQAFLSWVAQPQAQSFQLRRAGRLLVDDPFAAQPGRKGHLTDEPPPDRVDLRIGDRDVLRLRELSVPDGPKCHVFADAGQFFITALDGPPASMEKGRWYEWSLVWELPDR